MATLFAWFWRKRLEDGERVIKVKGWRSALIERRGSRRYVTFCGWFGD